MTNEVGETTTLHWHGMHLPARMDGGPHQMIDPGTTWRPHWQVRQPAATLWYHPHLHDVTAQHVYRGLAGLFLLDDEISDRAGLPSQYGVDDIPVIVQDKKFTDGGQLDLDERLFGNTGLLGATVLTNGTIAAHQEVTTTRVRLRLLNASNARYYSFGIAEGDGQTRPFHLVGTDGGLLDAPALVERVQLSPGERAEIVVDMTPHQVSTLRSFSAAISDDPWNQRFAGGDDTLDILELRAEPVLRRSSPLPLAVPVTPPPDADDAAGTRTFRLGGTSINGLDMDMGRIDQVVPVDTTEIWEVTNPGGVPHNFHVHDVQFRVLGPDLAASPTHAGWKDTVRVHPGQTLRLLLRFTDYTDPDHPYMFHCHLLRHEDQGMMGQFVVVAPGDRLAEPSGHQHQSRSAR